MDRHSFKIIGLLVLVSGWLFISACTDVVETYPPNIRPVLPGEQSKAVTFEYHIMSQDVLEIFVWRQQDLTRDVVVSPDGNISFPLIGTIKAQGLTLGQLDDEITKLLKEYLREADVSIAVRSFAGEKVFIFGEVGQPGILSFIGHASLVEMLGQAKGWTKEAKLENVLVIRGDITSNNPEVIKVNVANILKGNLRENIEIYPKDIIYVPSTIIADISRFLRDYISPIFQTIVTVDYFRKH